MGGTPLHDALYHRFGHWTTSFPNYRPHFPISDWH
jgi:hypothetical protein